ncbi:MAG: hypothetical protein KDA25_00165 [Phycisphaerales bacterium]|nr:hypothetical protein [Phycisphaerales bacterium]
MALRPTTTAAGCSGRGPQTVVIRWPCTVPSDEGPRSAAVVVTLVIGADHHGEIESRIEGAEHRVLDRCVVRLDLAREDGLTHIDAYDVEDSTCVLRVSWNDDGRVLYARTAALAQAGLAGGTYAAPKRAEGEAAPTVSVA